MTDRLWLVASTILLDRDIERADADLVEDELNRSDHPCMIFLSSGERNGSHAIEGCLVAEADTPGQAVDEVTDLLRSTVRGLGIMPVRLIEAVAIPERRRGDVDEGGRRWPRA